MPKVMPTLIDDVYFNCHKVNRLKYLIPTLEKARKFVLDSEMSAFLADIALNAFKGPEKTANVKGAGAILDQMRRMSRAPFPVTWIEFDHKSLFIRRKELAPAQITASPDETCANEGWLICQHPGLPNIYHSTLMFGQLTPKGVDKFANVTGEMGILPYMAGLPGPFTWAWSVDNETHIPFEPVKDLGGRSHSEIPLGILGYESPFVKVIYRPGLEKQYRSEAGEDFGNMFLKEFIGDLRYTWALLSTINDLPILAKEIRPSKGYLAKGRWRKFMSHSLITLQVPTRMSKEKLARKILALSRRRRHEVRGHYRVNWRNPAGEKIWIDAHMRGDATLGFVSHTYNVERGEDARTNENR